jgi:hypothetical protein
MDEYESMLRDMVRDARRFDRDPLKRAEIATILRKDATVADEALGGQAELFIEALEDRSPHSLAGVVMMLLRKQCEEHVAEPLREMREQIELEDRLEDEYQHGVTA